MNLKALLVLLVGLGVLAALSVFTVDQRQVAILLQFGKVERTDLAPGLHFKVPVVQNVMKFDARIQTLDSDPQNYLTFEKKNVIVDSFVKWRIAGRAPVLHLRRRQHPPGPTIGLARSF